MLGKTGTIYGIGLRSKAARDRIEPSYRSLGSQLKASSRTPAFSPAGGGISRAWLSRSTKTQPHAEARGAIVSSSWRSQWFPKPAYRLFVAPYSLDLIVSDWRFPETAEMVLQIE